MLHLFLILPGVSCSLQRKLAIPRRSLNEGQESKSSTAPKVQMEPSNLSRSALQYLPPTSGSKRHRSSSWPESLRKRQSDLPEPAPTPTSLEPLPPETDRHLSGGEVPCWGCFSPPKTPSDVASLDDELDIDQLKLPLPSLPSSQD